jgi:hypothetical protein
VTNRAYSLTLHPTTLLGRSCKGTSDHDQAVPRPSDVKSRPDTTGHDENKPAGQSRSAVTRVHTAVWGRRASRRAQPCGRSSTRCYRSATWLHLRTKSICRVRGGSLNRFRFRQRYRGKGCSTPPPTRVEGPKPHVGYSSKPDSGLTIVSKPSAEAT